MEKRRQAILDIVNQLGKIGFSQLSQYFPDISAVTLRKDLKYLDESKQLVRIHGGAKSLQQVVDFNFRSNLHQKEKAAIANKALALIHPGDSVYISAGSTCIELARRFPTCLLYVFTDGLYTAVNLPRTPDVSVEILGGHLEQNNMRMSGPAVLDSLENLHFNTAFLGTYGFHPDHGFSNQTAIAAAVVEKVVRHSDKVVILMDSSKVVNSCTPWITPTKLVDVIITDGMLNARLVDKFQKEGITVL